VFESACDLPAETPGIQHCLQILFCMSKAPACS